MEIEFTSRAKKELEYWKSENNEKVLKRIHLLIKSILESPYSGIGKPEPLKYQFSGKWSRRINPKDRLVYQVIGEIVYIYSCKGHYY